MFKEKQDAAAASYVAVFVWEVKTPFILYICKIPNFTDWVIRFFKTYLSNSHYRDGEKLNGNVLFWGKEMKQVLARNVHIRTSKNFEFFPALKIGVKKGVKVKSDSLVTVG